MQLCTFSKASLLYTIFYMHRSTFFTKLWWGNPRFLLIFVKVVTFCSCWFAGKLGRIWDCYCHATYVFEYKYGEKFSNYLGLSASRNTTIIYSLTSNGSTRAHTHMWKHSYIAECLRLHLTVSRKKKDDRNCI